MRRRLPITLLMLGFSWTTYKGIEKLIWPGRSADYILMNDSGHAWLFFVISVIVIVLNGCALWAYTRLKRSAVKFGLIAVGTSLIQNTISYIWTLANHETAKEAYIVSRVARGLPIHEDVTASVLSPTGLLIAFVVSLMIPLAGAAIILATRNYIERMQD